MMLLGKSNGEVEIGISNLHLDPRVSSSVARWHSEKGRFAVVEGDLLDGVGSDWITLSDLDKLIVGCELQGRHLLPVMEDSHSNGSQPRIVPGGLIRDKESIHLKLSVADQVEGGVVCSLEGVAEQLSSRQPDGKVWV